MANKSFEPDGTYGELPYRVLDTGQIDVLIEGRIVRLKSVEQFIALVSGTTFLVAEKTQEQESVIRDNSDRLIKESEERSSEVSPTAIAAGPKKASGGKIIVWLVIVPLFIYLVANFISGGGVVARKVVAGLNSEYGTVCTATLEGWSSDILKINWTSRTTKLNSIQVIAAVGTAKSVLYNDGVRYFKFPNDVGGYNIIDWKTGEKRSVSERVPYYFR